MDNFAIRGFIEGFYGRPWPQETRLGMLKFAAENGFNTCYYAPKDDPFHRAKWRSEYDREGKKNLSVLSASAAALGIDLRWCVAPGLDIAYSSEKDFEDLKAKTLSVHALGINSFGLLLDDIPAELYHAGDREKFPSLSLAHAYLINRYYAFLRDSIPGATLTVCPTQYCGRGDEEYIVSLCRSVPDDVLVFFTGPDICSRRLTSRDAEYFAEKTGRQPLYWDNYPVNDAEMFKEMHLGPLTGRDTDLYKYCRGIVSNCSEYAECCKIPLYTIGRYLSAPALYDPEKAWKEALELITGEDYGDFLLFADHLRFSCLPDENSKIMGEVFGRAALTLYSSGAGKALPLIIDYVSAVGRAAENLARKKAPLYTELAPWLRKFYLMAEILTLCEAVLEGDINAKAAAVEKMESFNCSATVLGSFCFREFVERTLETAY